MIGQSPYKRSAMRSGRLCRGLSPSLAALARASSSPSCFVSFDENGVLPVQGFEVQCTARLFGLPSRSSAAATGLKPDCEHWLSSPNERVDLPVSIGLIERQDHYPRNDDFGEYHRYKSWVEDAGEGVTAMIGRDSVRFGNLEKWREQVGGGRSRPIAVGRRIPILYRSP
jgi:hypothetical protein